MEGANEERPANGARMGLLDGSTHSFVLKIWLEDAGGRATQATWRGHITHVPGGERRYFQDLHGLLEVLVPYLESMGVEVETP